MDDDNKIGPDLRKQIEEADAAANESGEVKPVTLENLVLDDHDEFDGVLPTERIAKAAEEVIEEAATADKLAQDPPPDIDLKALTDEAYENAKELREKSEEALKVVGQQRVEVSAVADGTVRRNGPCPCGSGKKFKKCCRDDVQSGALKPVYAFGKKYNELPDSGYEEPRAVQKQKRAEEIRQGAKRIPHLFTKLTRPGQGMVLEEWGFRKRPNPMPKLTEEDPTVD